MDCRWVARAGIKVAIPLIIVGNTCVYRHFRMRGLGLFSKEAELCAILIEYSQKVIEIRAYLNEIESYLMEINSINTVYKKDI